MSLLVTAKITSCVIPYLFRLTAARAVTCVSNEPPITASRVSTRSSKMMSQDQGATPNLITPVNKIRGLVKTLAPRKRQTKKTGDSPNPTTEDPTEPQKSPQQKMTLMKSMKRKRTTSNSNLSTSPKKVKNEEGASDDPKLSRNLSQLIPVVKLTRTAGTANNYVAFLAEKNGKVDKETDVKSNNQSLDSTSHKHNTRYKGKKLTSHDSNDNRKTPDVQNEQGMSLPNGEPLVEVYTKQPSTPTSMLDENPKGKHWNVNKAYAKRGVQPRNHNQEMRVGDIVWGKVHGHPWWPGRILGILCQATESVAGFVKVAWYGSTTTSDISCSFLLTFEENFKQLFKKQKHGAYRRAVREAQQDIQVMSVDGQVLQV